MNITLAAMMQWLRLPLPLPRRNSLFVVGVFHLLCMVCITSAFALHRPFYGPIRTPWWVMPVVIANALVAIGVTAPLSRTRPSFEWRSIWLLCVFIILAIVTLLVHRYDDLPYPFPGWRRCIPPLTFCTAIPMYPVPYVSMAIVCYLAIAAVSGRLHARDVAFAGWQSWAGVVTLIFIARWNTDLCFVPSYLLVAIGFHVAYSSLGRDWFLRTVSACLISVGLCCAIAVCRVGWEVVEALRSHTANAYDVFHVMRRISALPPFEAPFHGLCYRDSSSALRYISAFPGLALAMVVYYWSQKANAFGKVMSCCVYAVISLFMLLTAERTAVVTVVGLVPIWLLLRRRIALRTGLLWILTASAVALVSVLIPGSHIVKVLEHGTNYRLAFAQSTTSILGGDPWFGVGPGWYWRAFSLWAAHTGFPLDPVLLSPHNDILEVLTETGVVGFTLAVLAAWQVIRVLHRAYRKCDWAPGRLLALGFGTQCIAVALCTSHFEGVFVFVDWLIPTAALIPGLLAVMDRHAQSECLQERPVVCGDADLPTIDVVETVDG